LRFSTFGWRATATVVTALVGVAMVPLSASAAPKNDSLSGNVGRASGLGYNGTVISNSDGTAVRGAFKVNLSNGGNVTVDATCLQTTLAFGGRAAGAGGVVKTSTDPSVPVGSGIVVRAFDSDDPARPDTLDLFAAPKAPEPNQCDAQLDPGSPISKGKITIKVGF
jgi:hypothetical protein